MYRIQMEAAGQRGDQPAIDAAFDAAVAAAQSADPWVEVGLDTSASFERLTRPKAARADERPAV